jgi:hypothetical protein
MSWQSVPIPCQHYNANAQFFILSISHTGLHNLNTGLMTQRPVQYYQYTVHTLKYQRIIMLNYNLWQLHVVHNPRDGSWVCCIIACTRTGKGVACMCSGGGGVCLYGGHPPTVGLSGMWRPRIKLTILPFFHLRNVHTKCNNHQVNNGVV